MSKIKRSMTVHPASVIREPTSTTPHQYRVRAPTQQESRDRPSEQGYEVGRVTNSVDYRPGDLLTRDQLQALINDDWTITVLGK